jgi:hypothetical protein
VRSLGMCGVLSERTTLLLKIVEGALMFFVVRPSSLQLAMKIGHR